MMSDRTADRALKEEKVFTLVDQLLAEQQTLSAVDHFSRLHDRDALPALANHYKALLPAAPPGPGEQYAFEVNLDACTGCKACVSACHSLNGLDEDESWRDVGLLLGGRRKDAYQQVVTTACHHCADPACMNGCPVGAYEKEADTGIVRHLDDQCIGCQYCVLKCPYDVPKYSESRGIVRKCDMCVGRLREGEAPACVQACPTSAISIRVVKKEDLTFTAGTTMLPGAFDSSYTQPASLYRTTKVMPKNTQPADASALRLDHAHWPLVWMLVLTQMSVGMFVMVAGLIYAGDLVASQAPLLYGATALLMAALGISVLHLGRPLGAWRFFIGLRTSWMSREILAFSMLAGCASTACAALHFNHAATMKLTALTAAMGLLAVFTSVMIYVDTRRPFWNARLTFGKFFGTTAVLGLAASAALTQNKVFIVAALVARALLFAWEQRHLRVALVDDDCPWHSSARVMKLRLPWLMNVGDGLFPITLALSVSALAMHGLPLIIFSAALLIVALAAQVLERYTFFVAVMGPRMTGGYRS